MLIGTTNVKTLLGDAQLYELEEELAKIKWDIIEISEIKCHAITLKSVHIFYHKGQTTITNEESVLLSREKSHLSY